MRRHCPPVGRGRGCFERGGRATPRAQLHAEYAAIDIHSPARWQVRFEIQIKVFGVEQIVIANVNHRVVCWRASRGRRLEVGDIFLLAIAVLVAQHRLTLHRVDCHAHAGMEVELAGSDIFFRNVEIRRPFQVYVDEFAGVNVGQSGKVCRRDRTQLDEPIFAVHAHAGRVVTPKMNDDIRSCCPAKVAHPGVEAVDLANSRIIAVATWHQVASAIIPHAVAVGAITVHRAIHPDVGSFGTVAGWRVPGVQPYVWLLSTFLVIGDVDLVMVVVDLPVDNDRDAISAVIPTASMPQIFGVWITTRAFYRHPRVGAFFDAFDQDSLVGDSVRVIAVAAHHPVPAGGR